MAATVTTAVTAAKARPAAVTAPAPPAAGMPPAPALPADLEALLRGLRLPHSRAHAPDVLATAKAQRWEPAEVLKALLVQEAAGQARSALATRRAAAAFPTGKRPELVATATPVKRTAGTVRQPPAPLPSHRRQPCATMPRAA